MDVKAVKVSIAQMINVLTSTPIRIKLIVSNKSKMNSVLVLDGAHLMIMTVFPIAVVSMIRNGFYLWLSSSYTHQKELIRKNLANCPCNENCPKGCPCESYECKYTSSVQTTTTVKVSQLSNPSRNQNLIKTMKSHKQPQQLQVPQQLQRRQQHQPQLLQPRLPPPQQKLNRKQEFLF